MGTPGSVSGPKSLEGGRCQTAKEELKDIKEKENKRLLLLYFVPRLEYWVYYFCWEKPCFTGDVDRL